ncbi:MAG: type II toxin-antitoxin system RelE/ParE family toxin [Candidatus Nanopelagicales bacterium]
MPRLSKRAQQDLDSLPPALRPKADAILAKIDAEPGIGHKLLGKLEGLRSARVGRSHRLIYEVVEGEVRVLSIPNRRDAYR